jgi:alkylation response protein AidB-like acyl-CoA dehydrogenase
VTDLLYSDEQAQLRTSVREMLAQHSPVRQVLARLDPDPAAAEAASVYDAGVWHILAQEMGLAGLLVPERFGGAGAGPRVAAVVLEELGRSLAPVPYLSSSVIAASALLACSGDDTTDDVLAKLATGQTVAVLAVAWSTSPFAWSTSQSMRVQVTGELLTGTVTSVADAVTADVFLVPAVDGLYAVDAAQVQRRAVPSLDPTRPLADLSLSAVPGRLIAGGEAASTAIRSALLVGAALLGSEQLGLAEWCLDSTVEYVKGRYQFGRPVGSFQAIKHRLADVWVDLTQARAVARYAAAVVGGDVAALGSAGPVDHVNLLDTEVAVAVALAQASCSPITVKAAEECLQLHGGIGFTWEHPVHLYLKRAKSCALALGTAEMHRQALAGLVDLPA